MRSKLETSVPASPIALPHAEAVRVREALRAVLESAPFRGTRQCQSLLTYIVEHTLSGEGDLLRERVVGTQVFGRDAGYEPSEDPVVRMRAAEVRKRLAQYYQNRTDDEVRIEIPPGSYRAVFQWKKEHPEPAPPQVDRPAFAPPRWLWALIAVMAVVTIVVAIRAQHATAPAALEQFWAPALASPKPMLLYNATTTVFHAPDFTPSPHDLIAIKGQYTCIGDAYASVMLSSLFSRKGKLYQMRYGADLTFGDLRYQPSILIGAFNNAWTLQTTNELRFIFDKHPTIRDRSDNRVYSLPDLAPDGRTPEDYAIVSRVFDSKTGELLIAVAGITQYGTRAAGEFLTSPSLMNAMAANAPSDWPKKNLQVLLHTKIVDETPGPPSIVTTHFW